jgi:hypothetical protein
MTKFPDFSYLRFEPPRNLRRIITPQDRIPTVPTIYGKWLKATARPTLDLMDRPSLIDENLRAVPESKILFVRTLDRCSSK